MHLTDLTAEFAELVRSARGTIEFKARFWVWLERQARGGPLAPLLSDMERHWSTVGQAPSLSEARDLLRLIARDGHAERVARIGERFAEATGARPEVEVILLAGLERPEGYSRFERGRNTIFLGLDHPEALAHPDHLELILSHELCHAVRDPTPAVLADYGGSAAMSHDDFVARHPFREHLVSEALATSVSELAYPGRADRRYVYFDEEDVEWCEAHRQVVADRMVLALERGEPYRTFYAEGSVTPGSPESCDYWFGFHFGRYLLNREAAGTLLRTPATDLLARHLEPFVERFVRSAEPARAAVPRSLVEVHDEPLTGTSLPDVVRDIYDEYAALLRDEPGLAPRLEARLREAIVREGLSYWGRAWDVYAFPLLISAEEQRHLRWASDGLLRLIERVIDLYRVDAEVREFFGFPAHLEELCCLEPGFRPHVALGRFDSYWSGRRLRYLELNANGSAGWVLAELLADEILELPGIGDVLQRHGAASVPLTSQILDGLLSAWRQARGERAEPRRIAIVDWSDVATISEQRRLATDFTRMGLEAATVSPEQLTFDGSELRGPAGPIDIVYRRLTTLDLIDSADELVPLLDAARAGAVVTVGSYGSDVAHSKRLFAFLTHERWQRRLSPAERSLIEAHVPWTRLFIPGRTQFEGRLHDLRELALAERERFVLKPAEGYEGREVLLGAETAPALWAAEVERRFGGAHVIQEMVRAPLRSLLLPAAGGGVEEAPRWLHLGELMIGGQLASYLARVSEELVLSVDSRERALPCLVLPDAEGDVVEDELGPAHP